MNNETYNTMLAIAGSIIAGLIVLVFYVVQTYISDNKEYKKKQDDKNDKFYDLINETKEALIKINLTLDFNQGKCDERHKIIKNGN